MQTDSNIVDSPIILPYPHIVQAFNKTSSKNVRKEMISSLCINTVEESTKRQPHRIYLIIVDKRIAQRKITES